MNTQTKQTALNKITKLANTHDISIDEIAGDLNAPNKKESNLTGKLFNYLGGIFVFSGICILTGLIWDDVTSMQRVILTLGTGVSALILGLLTHEHPRFEKATTPLLLMSAFLQPVGLLVFLGEYTHGDDTALAGILIFGSLAIQQILAFQKLRRTSLLFLALLFWNLFLTSGMEWVTKNDELTGIIVSISMLNLSYVISKTPHRAITPPWYFLGGVTLLTSWWSLFEGGPLDLTYLGINVILIYVSILTSSRTLLFVSVIGLISYMGYYAYEYFANAIGWPLCLILLGFAIIGLSAYGIKLGQKIKTISA